MKTEDLFREMVTKGILRLEKGRLNIYKETRCVVYPSHAMAITLQKIAVDIGESFLYKCGYKSGNDSIQEIMVNLKKLDKYMSENLKDITKLLQICGFGELEITNNNENSLTINVTNNCVLEYAKDLYGSESKVSPFFMGYLAAYLEKLQNIVLSDAKETKNISKGDEYTEWVFTIASK